MRLFFSIFQPSVVFLRISMYLVHTGAWVSLHIVHEVRGNLGNPDRQTTDKVQGNKFELPPLHLPQRTIFLALGYKNKGKKPNQDWSADVSPPSSHCQSWNSFCWLWSLTPFSHLPGSKLSTPTLKWDSHPQRSRKKVPIKSVYGRVRVKVPINPRDHGHMLPTEGPFEGVFGLEMAFRYLDISSYEDDSHHRNYILSSFIISKWCYFLQRWLPQQIQ